MRIITAIYLNLRPDIEDNYLCSENEVDVDDALVSIHIYTLYYHNKCNYIKYILNIIVNIYFFLYFY